MFSLVCHTIQGGYGICGPMSLLVGVRVGVAYPLIPYPRIPYPPPSWKGHGARDTSPPPHETTNADGTHPTGMLSCF